MNRLITALLAVALAPAAFAQGTADALARQGKENLKREMTTDRRTPPPKQQSNFEKQIAVKKAPAAKVEPSGPFADSRKKAADAKDKGQVVLDNSKRAKKQGEQGVETGKKGVEVAKKAPGAVDKVFDGKPKVTVSGPNTKAPPTLPERAVNKLPKN